MASLGGKGLKKRDGQTGPVNSFPPRGSPLTSKIAWHYGRQSKIMKGLVSAGPGEKELMLQK